MLEIKIRSAVECDAEIACSLFEQMRGVTYDLVEFKTAFYDKLKTSNNSIFVAEYNGEVVAVADVVFSQFLVPLAIQLTVENIIVDVSFRGKSIGKQLMDYIVEHAKKNECRYITLASGMEREKAHRFYENLGFTKTGYRFEYELAF